MAEGPACVAHRAMFRGDKINVTETGPSSCRPARAARHVDRRRRQGRSAEVHAVLDAMADFSNRVRAARDGPYGQRIRNVVNIGIGAPTSAREAYEGPQTLQRRAMTFRFVDVDGPISWSDPRPDPAEHSSSSARPSDVSR